MPTRHMIRGGYQDRPIPEYFHDDIEATQGIVCQPDVYTDAARVAQRLGLTRLVDVGCGTAGKLAPLADALDIVGIDIGPNIEYCQRELPFGTWIPDDLAKPGPLPVDTAGAVIVCADVVEHMEDPAVLLAKLHQGLIGSAVLLVSTPERELFRGASDSGPPLNTCHLREWNIREFGTMMRRAGFQHGTVGLTRNNDRQSQMFTILGAYAADPATFGMLEEALIDGPWPQPVKQLRKHMPYGVKHALTRRWSKLLSRIGE